MTEWLIGGVLVAVLAGCAYARGRVDGAAGPKLELHRLELEARRQAEHQQEVLRKLRLSHSELTRQKQALDREVRRVSSKVNYQRECLDVDGIRLFNQALGADRPTAGGTAGTVCKADPAVGWECGSGTAQAGGDGPTVE